MLVLVDWYPPAFRAGGPTRSVPGIVERIGERLDVRVVTRDRDLGEREPLPSVTADRWIARGHARVRYVSRGRLLLGAVIATVRSTRHDVLYLNSVLSPGYGLLPLLSRWIRLTPRRRLVIAPRGELDPGALGLKNRRKRLLLGLVRHLGLISDATWHAASAVEAASIRGILGPAADVVVAPPSPTRPSPSAEPPPPKLPGSIDLLYLGRITPKKGLHRLLEALHGQDGAIRLDIHGPVEDAGYWARCRDVIGRLPANVAVHRHGPTSADEVGPIIGRHHLFVLPTAAENYGHAIVESLLGGRPVLISDRTPWRDLEAKRAGWDVPLDDLAAFGDRIGRCLAMGDAEWRTWSAGAGALGEAIATDPAIDRGLETLFGLGPTGR